MSGKGRLKKMQNLFWSAFHLILFLFIFLFVSHLVNVVMFDITSFSPLCFVNSCSKTSQVGLCLCINNRNLSGFFLQIC